MFEYPKIYHNYFSFNFLSKHQLLLYNKNETFRCKSLVLIKRLNLPPLQTFSRFSFSLMNENIQDIIHNSIVNIINTFIKDERR